MAVTAQFIRRDGITSTNTADGQDSLTAVIRTVLDTAETDPIVVRALARGVTIAGDILVKIPDPGGQWSANTSSYLFAKTFMTTPVKEDTKVWDTIINWSVPDPGDDGSNLQPNPLLRPAVFNVEYIETEYPIEQAENLVALPHGDGKGGNRTVNTLGDLVNAAGKRPDEPQIDSERNAVLVIERNYASLAAIVSLNEKYQRTTNSDAFEGFAIETLKYMVTDSLGQRIEGVYTYFPGVTRIEKKKTTKRIISNTGYAYWDPDPAGDSSEPAAITEGDDNIKDLHSLAIDGTKDSVETFIEYRYLTRVPYAPLTA